MVEDAEDALCDLNMAGAIMVLCESSLFRTQAGHRFEQRIVKLCREHVQLQLRTYDRSKASLRSSTTSARSGL